MIRLLTIFNRQTELISKGNICSLMRTLAVGVTSLILVGLDTQQVQAAAPSTIISRKDRLELTDFYTNVIQQKARSELKLNGVMDRDAAVSVQLDFDEQRLTGDAVKWYKDQEDKQKKVESDQNTTLKASVAELIATARAEKTAQTEKMAAAEKQLQAERLAEAEKRAEAEKQAEVEKANSDELKNKANEIPGGQRIGRLNIDIKNSTISELLKKQNDDDKELKDLRDMKVQRDLKELKDLRDLKDQKTTPVVVVQESGITLAINIPTLNGMTVEPFIFKAADYIKKITAKITLPFGTPRGLDAVLISSLAEILDFKAIAKGASTKDWIKVAEAAAVAPIATIDPTVQSYVKNFWRPDNAIIAALASGILVGLFLLVSMIIASKALSKGIISAVATLGKDIASLKPAEEKEDAEVVVEESVEEETEDKYDSAAKGQALTHEMATIRDQFKILVADHTFMCAEYLRDMFYTPTGLGDFRDLLSFLGHTPLKPALDLLPGATIERLQVYMEENRDVLANILNGTEIAQRIYGECISKAALKTDAGNLLDPIRKELLETEDIVIAKYILEADITEIAVLLNTLTVERGNRLMKGIPIEKLKAAAAILDQPLANPEQTISIMVDKISKISATIVEKSQSQRRLILRLAKSVGVSEEEMVYELIAPEDWDLKRQIMGQKMFLKDVVYTPLKQLAQAFGSLPLKTRTEIMLVCAPKLKAALMNSLGVGSKKSEMLQTEIDLANGNIKKLAEIMTRKDPIMEAFMVAMRKTVSGSPATIDQIILAQAKALGLTPPSDDILAGETIKAA